MASSGHRKRPRYRPYVLPFIIFFNKTLPYPSYVVAVALIGSHFVVFFSLFVVDDDDDVLPLIELCFFFYIYCCSGHRKLLRNAQTSARLALSSACSAARSVVFSRSAPVAATVSTAAATTTATIRVAVFISRSSSELRGQTPKESLECGGDGCRSERWRW